MWFTRDDRLVAFLDHIRIVPRGYFLILTKPGEMSARLIMLGQRSAIALKQLCRPRIAFLLTGLVLAHLTTRRSDEQKGHVFSRHAR
jgi:hypothetical protein